MQCSTTWLMMTAESMLSKRRKFLRLYFSSSAIFIPNLLCSESLIFLFHFNHILIGAMWFHSARKSEIYKNWFFVCFCAIRLCANDTFFVIPPTHDLCKSYFDRFMFLLCNIRHQLVFLRMRHIQIEIVDKRRSIVHINALYFPVHLMSVCSFTSFCREDRLRPSLHLLFLTQILTLP